jgi:hypothetical protein
MDFNQINTKIMTLFESYTKLSSILVDAPVNISSELISEENNELIYSLGLFSSVSGFVSMKFQIIFNPTILREKIENFKEGYNPHTETIDFEEFIIRKNIQLLPYLKEYNGKETDYEKLTELYYIARGSVSGKRFGF